MAIRSPKCFINYLPRQLTSYVDYTWSCNLCYECVHTPRYIIIMPKCGIMLISDVVYACSSILYITDCLNLWMCSYIAKIWIHYSFNNALYVHVHLCHSTKVLSPIFHVAAMYICVHVLEKARPYKQLEILWNNDFI